MSGHRPVEYTCRHYSALIEGFARTLERCADVQNGLALEGETALGWYLSLALFRVLRDAEQALAEFLDAHDPEGHITRPSFVLSPPVKVM